MHTNERERLPGQTDLAYALEPVRIYSAKALQQVLGCSTGQANNLWNNRVRIGGRIALRLCQATGIPAEVFLQMPIKPARHPKAQPQAV